MSARTCPKCQRELPVEILRALEQGTSCPHCATRLKRAPAPVAPSPAPAVRSPLKPLPAVAMPGLTPSSVRTPEPPPRPAPAQSPPAPVPPAPVPAARPAAPAPPALEVARRPVVRDAAPPVSPVSPVEPRRAPTLLGTAPPPSAEKASPPAPAPSPIAPATMVAPPRTPLAMTAVLPAGGSTLALAGPALAFPLRSRRNIGIAVGTATVTVAVALLLSHHSPSHRPAPVPSDAPATTRVPIGSAPLATVHETSAVAPTIQPLRAESDPAAVRPGAAAPTIGQARGEAERGPAGGAIPKAHAKVRAAHHAAVHQRRLAKHDKHAKRARHEKHARRTEVASRATPVSGDDGDARASYQRGNALLFAGDAAGAVAAYRKAVELAPADPIGYRGLGLAYEQQGGTAAAVRALRKYLKLAPGAADREIISRRIARLSQGAGRP